jgi:hypothetical protein
MASQFIIPSNNHRGASERIAFRVLPELKRELEELFYSKRWPYMTFSDLCRHGLYRHCEWLAAQSPSEANIPYLEALIQTLNREHELILFQRVVDQLGEIVTEHIDAGNKDDAERSILKVLGAIDSMPQGSMRKKYEEQVLRKFGTVIGVLDGRPLEPGKIVGLLPEDLVTE